jgi:hypothetical protein
VADDALGDRKIFTGSYDFRAPSLFSPDNKHRLNKALPELASAIAETADLYQNEGRVLGLIDGKLEIVTSGVLAKIINENLARKGIRNVGTVEVPVFEREFKRVEVGEIVLRALLTDDQNGLLKVVPRLTEADVTPRGSAPPAVEAPPEPYIPATANMAEIEAGRRLAARFSAGATDERTRLELEQGARLVERERARARDRSVTTPRRDS